MHFQQKEGIYYFLRFFRTISYLKFRQIFYQIIRRLSPKKKAFPITASVNLRPKVKMSTTLLRQMQGEENEFTFLSITKRFDSAAFDWKSPECSRLWRYNLHYFDYLNEKNRPWKNKAFLLDSWITKNPQDTPDAWDPFPVSLRIVNWIKFFLSQEKRNNFEKHWLRSLYEQVLWLEKNIEYHLLANHYFKNGKALIFAGIFFDGNDAGRWFKKGLTIIEKEIDEQILDDGGHFERSPMYHSMILEDCLDLFNILGCSKLQKARELRRMLSQKASAMLVFLHGMCHPDGDIALFNDSAFGIEAQPAALGMYFEHSKGEIVQRFTGNTRSFSQTGYYIMSPRPGDYLIIDCGPAGPDYQMGHAHCDNLSFELSLNGYRVIVDSGCCQYEDSDIRKYNRGNLGHNTVTIDDENQSEVWGAHRCARRAYPLYAKLEENVMGEIRFEGAHNGYRRLKGNPIHHRKIIWKENLINIEDRIEGTGIHSIESRLHIHPELNIQMLTNGVQVSRSGKLLLIVSAPGDRRQIEVKNGWYCPEFNKPVSCQVIILKMDDISLPTSFGWKIDCNISSYTAKSFGWSRFC